MEEKLRVQSEKMNYMEWTYLCNINEFNQKEYLKSKLEYEMLKERVKTRVLTYDLSQDYEPKIKRKVKLLTMMDVSSLPRIKLQRFNEEIDKMKRYYNTAKLTDYTNNEQRLYHSLDPNITSIFATSSNEQELKYYWIAWRNATGRKMKSSFQEIISLYNEASTLNNLSNGMELMIQSYESTEFTNMVETLWKEIQPLYKHFHAYVRHKLMLKYGNETVSLNEAIPAHLLGNLWAQSWNNIESFSQPYPNVYVYNLTEEMKKQKWNAKTMMRHAQDFFVSMGFPDLPREFWDNSVFERSSDGRDMECHPSAWNFFNNKDYRVKMCAQMTREDFLTVTHEMGHIHYYLQYSNQSFLFQSGANAGFHEAVADVFSLAIDNPIYYHRIGLLKRPNFSENNDRYTINSLYSKALDRLALLPFGYIVDKYRWDVFSKEVPNLNHHWLHLRALFQGIQSPVKREVFDFDPGAKYHIAGNYEYIRYYLAIIYQFQFFKSLCLSSGHINQSLYTCDLYGSKSAGTKFKEMLRLGKSVHWKEALKILTGEESMSSEPLLEYFKPLEKWLKRYNRKHNLRVGWNVASMAQNILFQFDCFTYYVMFIIVYTIIL